MDDVEPTRWCVYDPEMNEHVPAADHTEAQQVTALANAGRMDGQRRLCQVRRWPFLVRRHRDHLRALDEQQAQHAEQPGGRDGISTP